MNDSESPRLWETTGSREVYINPWIRVREDDVVRPDGSDGVYGVVEVRQPAVFVVAVDDADHVVLVDLSRYTTGAGLEIPAGGSDGQDLLVAARRELVEETGLVAATWRELGVQWSLNGVAEAPCHVFLALGIAEAVADELPVSAHAEGIAAVRRVPWDEVAHMCADGRIRDGESVAALGLAAIALGRWR